MKTARLKLLVSTNVKAFREQRGWSQEKLGEVVGRSFQSISHIETGKTLPPLTTLSAIATALGVPLSALLTESPLAESDPRADLLTQASTMLADLDGKELDTAVKVVRALWEGRG